MSHIEHFCLLYSTRLLASQLLPHRTYQFKGPEICFFWSAQSGGEPLRRNCGIVGPALYARPTPDGEANIDAKVHPWVWACTPDDLLKEEARCSSPVQQTTLESEAAHDAYPLYEKAT